MKHSKADAVVIGVGAMGSAACYYLAKAGVRVVGIEQFPIGHNEGSSHGESRLIRKAYFEHPDYVPLLHRSYDLWEDLEAKAATKLLHKNGLVIYGDPAASPIYQGVLKSAKFYDLPIETYSYDDARRRFPYYHPPEGFSAVYEAQAGYLEVERCVETFAAHAQRHGAEIRAGEVVQSWRRVGNSFEVITNKTSYACDKLVVAAGAWTSKVLQELDLPLKVHRMVLMWYPAPDELSVARGLPCFGVEVENRFFYGLPKISNDGVKVGEHTPGPVLQNPEDNPTQLLPGEGERCTVFIQAFVAGKVTQPGRHAKCMYTMTPDEHFIVDTHPDTPNLVFAAGFSGHGFKFAPAIGKALAELTMKGETTKDLDFLKLRRFATFR